MNRWTVLLCALLLPTPAWADSDATVGVVNIAQVFEGYQMTRDLEARFDARRQNTRDEADSRRKAIDNQVAALEAFDPASKDFAERQEKLRQTEVEFRVWLELEEQRLKNEHMLWLRLIYDDVCQATARSAATRDIDLVLTYDELSDDLPDSSALRQEILLKKVLYFSERVDLTGEVLRLVNEAYEKRGGAASLGQPPAAPVPAPRAAAPPPDGTPE